MLVLDYLISNTDRHYNNFGLIRNVETLEYDGLAPIYDSGTSFYYIQLEHQIAVYEDSPAKPFMISHREQMKLVDLKLYDFTVLQGMENFISDLFNSSQIIQSYSNKAERINILNQCFQTRLDELQTLQNESGRQFYLKINLSWKANVPQESRGQAIDYTSDDEGIMI